MPRGFPPVTANTCCYSQSFLFVNLGLAGRHYLQDENFGGFTLILSIMYSSIKRESIPSCLINWFYDPWINYWGYVRRHCFVFFPPRLAGHGQPPTTETCNFQAIEETYWYVDEEAPVFRKPPAPRGPFDQRNLYKEIVLHGWMLLPLYFCIVKWKVKASVQLERYSMARLVYICFDLNVEPIIRAQHTDEPLSQSCRTVMPN